MELIQYIERGGIIVYILIAMNIVGFTIMLWKSFVIFIARLNLQKIANELLNELHVTKEYQVAGIHAGVALRVKKLESGLNTVKQIASISPLLGLLGTVIGILNSFDSISHLGLGDPTVFSSGISVALITTVAGLIVAIPHYIGYNYFMGALDSIEVKLENLLIEKLQ
jgi:biopolymer transport protein ExbB